jgi:uncharacterized membrane protein YebE (DUF533 family)
MLRAMDATSLLGVMLGSGFGRGRGPSLGTMAAGAAGVAAVGGLGYLAYRHFQGQKGAQPLPGGAPQGGAPGWGAPPGAPPAGGGGVGGFLSNIAGSTGGLRTDGFAVPGYEWQQGGGAQQQQPAAPPPPAANTPPAAPPVDYASLPAQPASPYAAPAASQPAAQNEQALLLVRAMIAAAYADGTIDDAERADILSRLDGAGVAAADREMFVRELASPKPVTALAAEVKSPELAEQFYVVSLLAMKIDSDAERAYARMLPALLQLSPEQVAAIHQKAGLPAVG